MKAHIKVVSAPAQKAQERKLLKFPKLVIASDGTRTGVLLDGIFIGQGIKRLDFSTQNENGEMESTIRIMDLNVDTAKLETDSGRFAEFLEKLASKD